MLILALLRTPLGSQQTNNETQHPLPDPSTGCKLLVVIPFENLSKAPGLEWIGEAFAEVLTGSIRSSTLYTIGREDRSYAFDRIGVPVTAHLSRATLYRIAEQMDVDYAIFGSYDYDGSNFTAQARLLDMKKLHLSPEATETGALQQLIDIQNALSWDMLNDIDPKASIAKNDFVGSAPRVRLDALENYIRGIIATETPDRVKRFKEAIRLSPDYTLAEYQLGKTYFMARDYPAAMIWLAKVPKSDAHGLEANFYRGLAAYYTGNFDRAEEAFSFVVSQLPLIEVYNNLGVVQARRGKKSAATYFQKAVEADPRDADYHFNYGVALLKTGDNNNAARQFKEAQALRPGDAEIKTAIDSASGPTVKADGPQPSARLPLERMKRNYDEASFRQLSMEIQRINETRLTNVDPRAHALKHAERGRELLKLGFKDEAQGEFRAAVALDPTLADAHVGLASIEQAGDNLNGARSEAAEALKLQPSAEAYLVLAQIDLKQNNPESANQNLQRALALEPANEEARTLQQSIAAKLGESSRNQ